jgi:hypothetical protein
MIRDLELARRLYAPSTGTMQKNLPDIGQSLDAGFCELSRELSLDRLDRLTAQLNSAQTNLVHLRKALVAERSTGHGTG